MRHVAMASLLELIRHPGSECLKLVGRKVLLFRGEPRVEQREEIKKLRGMGEKTTLPDLFLTWTVYAAPFPSFLPGPLTEDVRPRARPERPLLLVSTALMSNAEYSESSSMLLPRSDVAESARHRLEAREQRSKLERSG